MNLHSLAHKLASDLVLAPQKPHPPFKRVVERFEEILREHFNASSPSDSSPRGARAFHEDLADYDPVAMAEAKRLLALEESTPSPAETPTPRTDAAEMHSDHSVATCMEGMVDADFARQLERELAEKDKFVKIGCMVWAEDDTAIKAICAKHGIDEYHPDAELGFKTHVECVEELSVKLISTAALLSDAKAAFEQIEEANLNSHAVKIAKEMLSKLGGVGE